MINAIAIDDEPPGLKLIEHFCAKANIITLQKTFTKPQDALKYLNKNPVDLLFLDVNMPSISGVDFYKSLKQKVMVIFTTAFSEYAVEGFNVNAVDYLLKPYTYERFVQAVNRAIEQHRIEHITVAAPQYLVVRVDYSLVKIPFADITFIEGLDDYLKIHLVNAQPVIVRMTMKAIMEKLPQEFVRVHRSFIVAVPHIANVRHKTIFIAGEELPISSSYEEAFFTVFRQ